MEAVLDVEKKYIDKPSIKRVELEYGDMNYIIVNLVERVIDVDGKLWEYKISDEDNKTLMDLIWVFAELDDYDYWPDKSKEHHTSGATGEPKELKQLVDRLKSL